MPRRRTARRLGLHTPLARWGFAVCAAFALLNGLLWPALFSGAIALYAWKGQK